MPTLKTTINKFSAGTPVKTVDHPRPDMLVPTYDIILPDGTMSWAYDYEIEWDTPDEPNLRNPSEG